MLNDHDNPCIWLCVFFYPYLCIYLFFGILAIDEQGELILIQVKDLRKEFKKAIKAPGLMGSVKSLFHREYEVVNAVDGVTFEVPEGQILGFIGPNGAGKSTVIKMLTGILTPTSGVVEIDGKIPYKDRKDYVKDIGVVFGQRTQLWWDLPLTETFSVLKQIYQVEDDKFKKRFDFLNEVLDLNEFIKSPVRTLSLGQRMRADIAASMLHNPKVLFLDEPTIGLDVVVKDNIRKAIHEINEQEKTTIILTTHDLNDIELLCKRIVVIDKGKLLYDGSLQKMKRTFGQAREVNLTLFSTEDAAKFRFNEDLQLENEDLHYTVDRKHIMVKFNTDKITVSEMLNYILRTSEVRDISVKDVDIEEIIRRVYRSEVTL